VSLTVPEGATPEPSGLAVFERRFFISGHALFGHREQHGDADVGSGHPSQIDDLLFAKKRLRAIEQFVRDSMFGRPVVTKS